MGVTPTQQLSIISHTSLPRPVKLCTRRGQCSLSPTTSFRAPFIDRPRVPVATRGLRVCRHVAMNMATCACEMSQFPSVAVAFLIPTCGPLAVFQREIRGLFTPFDFECIMLTSNYSHWSVMQPSRHASKTLDGSREKEEQQPRAARTSLCVEALLSLGCESAKSPVQLEHWMLARM